jgi:hypothetical protein
MDKKIDTLSWFGRWSERDQAAAPPSGWAGLHKEGRNSRISIIYFKIFI